MQDNTGPYSYIKGSQNSVRPERHNLQLPHRRWSPRLLIVRQPDATLIKRSAYANIVLLLLLKFRRSPGEDAKWAWAWTWQQAQLWAWPRSFPLLPRKQNANEFPPQFMIDIKAVWIINVANLQDLNEPWHSLLILSCELYLIYSHTSTLVQEMFYVCAGPWQCMDKKL